MYSIGHYVHKTMPVLRHSPSLSIIHRQHANRNQGFDLTYIIAKKAGIAKSTYTYEVHTHTHTHTQECPDNELKIETKKKSNKQT